MRGPVTVMVEPSDRPRPSRATRSQNPSYEEVAVKDEIADDLNANPADDEDVEEEGQGNQ